MSPYTGRGHLRLVTFVTAMATKRSVWIFS